MDFLKGAADLIDRIKIILWPIFILTLTLTLLSDGLLEKLAVLNLVESYKTWISLALLMSASFILTDLGKTVFKAIGKWKKKREFKNRMKENLLRLSQSQNYIVHFLISNNTPSGLYLNMIHPEVTDLENKNIIYRTSTLGQLTSFAFSLTPLAISILNESEIILVKIAEGYDEDNIDESVIGETFY